MSLHNYIQGERLGKEAHQLEKESMQDPFLQDAIDGYDQITNPPDPQLKKLKKKINKRTRNNNLFLQVFSIFASIVIIILLSIIFFLYGNDKDETDYEEKIVYVEKYVNDSDASNDDVAAETEEANQQEDLFEAKGKSIIKQEKKRRPVEYPSIYSDQYYIEEINSNTLTDEEIQNIINSNYQDDTATLNQKSTPVSGERAYFDYLEKNRKKSFNDECDNKHGKVILLFKVNEKNRPIDISVLRSLCQEADREAIRLLQNGPDWTTSNSFTRIEITF